MAVTVLEQASWIAGSIAVRLGRIGFPPRRRAPMPPAGDLTIESADGLRVAATYWPGLRGDSPALLIVHGFTASRKVIQPNAEWFAARGYAVLTIDLRGHGGSSDAPCGFGWPESKDVHAAFGWLKRKQAGAKVAVIGISMGGAAALLGPDGPVPADAMVLQAVFSDIRHAIRSRIAVVGGRRFAEKFEPLFSAQSQPRIGVAPGELAPASVVARLGCPLLVIGGGQDFFTPPEETRALYDLAQPPKWLWMMPDLGHKAVSDTLDQNYRDRVFSFLRDTIGAPVS